MSITNVSTFGSLQTLLQNMNVVQTDLNNDSEEVSSGLKGQTFDAINGSVEQFTSLNAQVARLQDYQQNNSVVVSQLNTTNTVLGQIEQVATNVKGLIAAQTSGTTSVASFQQQIQANLSSIAGSLNTTFEGNYIFGGTKNDTPPVTTPVPATVQTGVPDASYYMGSSQDSTIRISDNQTIPNSIRADDPSFQQIIAGINEAMQASASNNTAQLQDAENLVSTGIQGVIALQSTANANIVTVQNVDTQSQTLQTYYQGLTTSISQSDVVSLSTQVAQDQSVLEATYSTFARISSLSLVNYLK